MNFCEETLPFHPNGMVFHIYQDGELKDDITAYSVGGGSIVWEGEDDFSLSRKNIYREKNLKEILETLDRNAYSFYDYVMEHENALFVDYLYEILDTMFDSVERGLKREGTIPGKLQLPRVAKQMYTQAINLPAGSERETLILSSYAYAVAEENASGQTIVTAPTCGSSGCPSGHLVLLLQAAECRETSTHQSSCCCRCFWQCDQEQRQHFRG